MKFEHTFERQFTDKEKIEIFANVKTLVSKDITTVFISHLDTLEFDVPFWVWSQNKYATVDKVQYQIYNDNKLVYKTNHLRSIIIGAIIALVFVLFIDNRLVAVVMFSILFLLNYITNVVRHKRLFKLIITKIDQNVV